MKKKILFILCVVAVLVLMASSAYASGICSEHTISGDGVVKAPTCSAQGYTTHTCTVCGYEVISNKTTAEHSYKAVSSQVNSQTATLTRNVECVWCGKKATQEISLIDKCYIEGYDKEIFDATPWQDYFVVSVTDGKGTITPSDRSSWAGEVFYFPSFIKKDEQVVEITTISSFNGGKNLRSSIAEIYVPDTVTRLVGGGEKGAFGNLNGALKAMVFGKGITVIEQEVFSMAGACYLDKLIFMNTLTSVGSFAFQGVNVSSSFDWENNYRFKTSLDGLGFRAFSGSNIIKEVYVNAGCEMLATGNNWGFSFNNSNNLIFCVYNTNGTKENPHVMGQETWSSTPASNPTYIITGYVTVAGQAVVPVRTKTIYMDSVDAIKVFVASVAGYNYSERLNNATFMVCSEEKAYKVTTLSTNADEVVLTEVENAYQHCYNETITNVANCNEAGAKTFECYSCKSSYNEEIAKTDTHAYNGGEITLEAVCGEYGVIVYMCKDCGQEVTEQIGVDPTNHKKDGATLKDVSFKDTYLNKGYCVYLCSLCPELFEEAEPTFPALFSTNGFTHALVDGRGAIMQSFGVDRDAFLRYKAVCPRVQYGVVAASGEKYSSIYIDGAFVDGAIRVDFTNRSYDIMELKIYGISASQKDVKLYCCAYVQIGDDVVFIDHGEQVDAPVSETYANLGGEFVATVSTDAIVPNKENDYAQA